VLVARAADRLDVIVLSGNKEAGFEFCRELREHSRDVKVALRTDNNAPEPRRATPMPAKFPGRCANCATAIRLGEPIFYDSSSRQAVHERCGR